MGRCDQPLFDLAVDGKLRGGDVIWVWIGDAVPGGVCVIESGGSSLRLATQTMIGALPAATLVC